MSRKPFYLSKRGKYWYARLVDPETETVLSAKSTGQTDRDMASAVAGNWVLTGKIKTSKETTDLSKQYSLAQLFNSLKTVDLDYKDANRIVEILKVRGLLGKTKQADNQDFVEFLRYFYDYDKSPYVREKLAHGHSIGKRHCLDSLYRIKLYIEPVFKKRILSSVTRGELRDFFLDLAERGLSASSINKVISTIKVALSWAHKEGLLTHNPSEKLTAFVGKPKEKGILDDEETNKLFSVEWEEERSYVANLVAATCGLRAGEVLALRKEDIGLDRLFVRHAWSHVDGLKAPKNGEQRQIPLLSEVRKRLLALSEKNPWDDGFIFFSTIENQPMDQTFLKKGLYKALEDIGISNEERLERNIVFHSWRHRYAAKMADLVDARSLGLATGHKTPAMLEHYAAHVNEQHFNNVKRASEVAFISIGN